MAHRVALALGGATLLLGLAVILRAKCSFIFVSSRGIILKPAFAPFRHMAWARVRRVEYRSVVGQLTFHSDRSKLAVGLMLRGLSSLLARVRASLPTSLYVEALARLEKDYLRNRWSRDAS